MKVIQLILELDGTRTAIKSTDDLFASINKLESKIAEVGKSSQLGKDLGKELRSLQNLYNQTAREAGTLGTTQSRVLKEGSTSIRGMVAQVQLLQSTYERLTSAERRTPFGVSTARSIRTLNTSIVAARGEFRATNTVLRRFAADITRVGNVLSGGLLLGGAIAVFQELKQVVADLVRTTADFERQLSFVGQVAGQAFDPIATGANAGKVAIEVLRSEALRLGGITEFTASQVAQLEIEYAKLGFTAPEILGLLTATLNTATVAQEDLGETAKVVGQTIRAFQLDTSSLAATQASAARVANVLAKAFSSSALDLSKFRTALATVGAVAAATGESLELITAELGILTNVGFDASIAATSLRNIFIENAALGKTLSESLDEVANAQNSLTKANELFGKRGAAAAVTLALQQKETAALAKTLQETALEGSFADQAAATIRADLLGAIEATEAALERLKITFTSVFADALNDGIRIVATGLTVISDLIVATTSTAGNLGESLGNLGFSESATSATLAGIRAIRAAFSGLFGALLPIIPAIQTAVRAVVDVAASLAQAAIRLGVLQGAFSVIATGVVIAANAFTFAATGAAGLFKIISSLVVGLNSLGTSSKIITTALLAIQVQLVATVFGVNALRISSLAAAAANAVFGASNIALAKSMGIMRAATFLASTAISRLFLLIRRNPIASFVVAVGAIGAAASGADASMRGLVGTLAGIAAASQSFIAQSVSGYRLLALSIERGILRIREAVGEDVDAQLAINYDNLIKENELQFDSLTEAYNKARDKAVEEFDQGTDVEVGFAAVLADEEASAVDQAEKTVKAIFSTLANASAQGKELPLAQLKLFQAQLSELLESGIGDNNPALAKQIATTFELLTQAIDDSATDSINELKAKRDRIIAELGTLERGTPRFLQLVAQLKAINVQIAQFNDLVSGEVKSTFQLWTELQKDLAEEIKRAIVAQEDYSTQLDRYLTVSSQINKANDEFKLKVELLAAVQDAAAGTTTRLTAQLALLKEELAQANSFDAELSISADIATTEQELERLKEAIQRVRQPIEDPDRTSVLDIDLKDELDAIEVATARANEAARETFAIDEEYRKAKAVNDLRAEEAILQARLALYKDGSAQFTQIELDLAETRSQIARATAERDLIGTLSDLDKKKLAELEAAIATSDTRRQLDARTRVIGLNDDIARLKLELELEQDNANRIFEIKKELAEKELDLQKAKQAQVAASYFKLNDEIAEATNLGLKAVQTGLELNEAVDKRRDARRIAAIEQKYEADLRLAGENEVLQEEAARRRDEAVRAIEEAAFERNKRLQIALALISGAQAIVSTLAAVPGPLDVASLSTARIAQIALVAATTAAQVITIQSTSFAKGGYTGNGGGGKADDTGHVPVGVVHAYEYVIPKKVLATPEGKALAAHAESLRTGTVPSTALASMIMPPNLAVTALAEANEPITINTGDTTADLSPQAMRYMSAMIEDKLGRALDKAFKKQEARARANKYL